MFRNNLTNRFDLDNIDHDELLYFLSLYYATAWRTRDQDARLTTEIALPAEQQCALRLRYQQGRITEILRGPVLKSKGDLDALLQAIRVNCRDPTTREFGRGLLMTSRIARGGYRADAVRLQLLVPPADFPRSHDTYGQHPILIEFPIRRWEDARMRLWRRYKCLTEWAWVLNALLNANVTVDGPRPSKAWVLNPTDHSHFYARVSFPQLPGDALIAALSPAGNAMPVVDADLYYSDVGNAARAALPLEELIVPNNLAAALTKFDALNGMARHRFLSAASMISIASMTWESSITTSFIAAVQAIECVAQSLPKKARWLFWTRPIGPVRRFMQICEAHGAAAGVDRKTLKRLYAIRSGIVHGESLFDIDRHPWGTGMAGSVLGLDDIDGARAATLLAKTVLRDWLMHQP